MKIITKKDIISNVSARWDFQHRNGATKEQIQIGNRLREDNPQTEKEVANIIGNDEWVFLMCEVCGEECNALAVFKNKFYSDISVCDSCMRKALEQIAEQNK